MIWRRGFSPPRVATWRACRVLWKHTVSPVSQHRRRGRADEANRSGEYSFRLQTTAASMVRSALERGPSTGGNSILMSQGQGCLSSPPKRPNDGPLGGPFSFVRGVGTRVSAGARPYECQGWDGIWKGQASPAVTGSGRCAPLVVNPPADQVPGMPGPYGFQATTMRVPWPRGCFRSVDRRRWPGRARG